MDKCAKCGGEGRMQPIDRYQPRKELMGGMQIELVNVVTALVCEKCGTTLRADIPDMPGLIAAVSVARAAKQPLKLSGPEIRFLRKAIGKSAKELAEDLRVTDETVSRWENGHLLMGEHIERIFRWTVCDELGDRTAIEWDHDEVLKKMNIVSVSARPLVMYFNRPEPDQKRRGRAQPQRYVEEQRKAA